MDRRQSGAVGGPVRAAAVVACLCLLPAALGSSIRTARADEALILPGALHSLLLDVARAGERLVAVGERGHILCSDDAGVSWTQVRVPVSVMLTRIFFVDDHTGWAVGHDGDVLLSEDAGDRWQLQRHGPSEQDRINEERVSRAAGRLAQLQADAAAQGPSTPEQLEEQVAAARHELELAREILAEPVFPPPLMGIWFSTPEQGWASGAFGTLLRTANGGRLWEDWGYKLPNPEELHLNGVAGDSQGNVYLASEWGYVFHSGNGGQSWQAVETGYDGSFFGVLVNPVSDSVFAYGLRGTIYRSLDRGRNWEALETGTRSSLFGATAGDRGALVFVGQNGTALLSRDDGASFVRLTGAANDLTGVAALPDGRLIATGEGGSVALHPPSGPE